MTNYSVEITVVNATAKTLTCTAQGPIGARSTVQPYSQQRIEGTDSQGMDGWVNFAGGGLNYSMSYQTSTKSEGSFKIDAEEGSLYVYQVYNLGGIQISVMVTLYEGVRAGTGWVPRLAPAADIGKQMACAGWVFHDFVEGMFADGVRDVIGAITDAAPTVSSAWHDKDPTQRPPVYYADMTGGQIPTIVDILTAHWMDDSAPAAASDRKLIDFLQKFLVYGYNSELAKAQVPQLYIPRLNFQEFHVHHGEPSTLAIFELEAYDNQWIMGEPGKWTEDAVRIFLTLLVAGAHFVPVRYAGDGIDSKFAGAMDFRALLVAQLGHHGCNGNSHYVDTAPFNGSGYYYIVNIDDETLPLTVDDGDTRDYPGLLISLMSALTNDTPYPSDYNSFFQLEGWPAHGLTNGGTRHHLDYDASTDTYWNISTFGASPYSEKRGGTVFIAPPGWVPVVTQVTCMMPYYGAWGQKGDHSQPQPWFKSYLVTIPTDPTQVSTLTLFQ